MVHSVFFFVSKYFYGLKILMIYIGDIFLPRVALLYQAVLNLDHHCSWNALTCPQLHYCCNTSFLSFLVQQQQAQSCLKPPVIEGPWLQGLFVTAQETRQQGCLKPNDDAAHSNNNFQAKCHTMRHQHASKFGFA